MTATNIFYNFVGFRYSPALTDSRLLEQQAFHSSTQEFVHDIRPPCKKGYILDVHRKIGGEEKRDSAVLVASQCTEHPLHLQLRDPLP